MKKIIWLILILLCLPLVYSLYGGQTWQYHFSECDRLEVNITSPGGISDGEYTILSNCTMNGSNFYVCDCVDGFDFVVDFNIQTLNNYTFSFNYDYSRLVSSHSHHSNRCVPDWNCTGWGACQVNNLSLRNCVDLNDCIVGELVEEKECVYFIPDEGKIIYVNEGELEEFYINNNKHSIKLLSINGSVYTFEISSDPIIISLSKGENVTVNIEEDYFVNVLLLETYDSRVKLSLNYFKDTEDIIIKDNIINDTIEEVVEGDNEVISDIINDPGEPKNGLSPIIIICLIVLVCGTGLVIVLKFVKKKKD